MLENYLSTTLICSGLESIRILLVVCLQLMWSLPNRTCCRTLAEMFSALMRQTLTFLDTSPNTVYWHQTLLITCKCHAYSEPLGWQQHHKGPWRKPATECRYLETMVTIQLSIPQWPEYSQDNAGVAPRQLSDCPWEARLKAWLHGPSKVAILSTLMLMYNSIKWGKSWNNKNTF